MSTPQSTIYICSGVKLNNRYEHTIYWDSRDAQQNYFRGKVVKTFSGYTFLRKSWTIKVEATLADARSWNYLYFCNSDGRYWYYFINQVEYVNDATVELYLELDVMQSYALDYDLLPCFVERQHTLNDGIGDNCVDEDLELGELVTIASATVPMDNMSILVLTSIVPNSSFTQETAVKVKGSYYNGVFNGLGIYAFPASKWLDLADMLEKFDELNLSDSILTMWMYPSKLINFDGDAYTDQTPFAPVASIKPFYFDTPRPNKLAGGYVPRNNKLYCYPYNLLYVTNNSGVSASFRYERFGDPTCCNFKITGALSPEAEIRMYPLNYNGEQHAYEHGLALSGFPTCAWNQDVYKLWLAQNQNQRKVAEASSALSIGAGVASIIGGVIAKNPTAIVGGVAGVASGVKSVADQVATKKDTQLQPPQAKGTSSASVNTVAGFQTFSMKAQTVTAEMAMVIDGYFDLFGYKINYVQIPHRATRENWTYIKTNGCHINGNFAVEDIVKIESIFDSGVTFWRNGDNVGNYSLSNKPV